MIDLAAARRAPIDADPAFLSAVEECIRGDIGMKAMRHRYLEIIALQAADRRGLHKTGLGKKSLGSLDEANEEYKNGPAETAAHEVWRCKTSRGEQLLRRNSEVTIMCISRRHYA
ncbi:hypothetical protein [Rhizobium sp. NFACC06-2]|uniref:hypothetical protein n=1 Tax=Rhizobium sp. NFACC06-2 TaxID=1566264 RepID=UPI00122C2222|nr:hypothetical protein [Rhizobium sp. NFACC06-2]